MRAEKYLEFIWISREMPNCKEKWLSAPKIQFKTLPAFVLSSHFYIIYCILLLLWIWVTFFWNSNPEMSLLPFSNASSFSGYDYSFICNIFLLLKQLGARHFQLIITKIRWFCVNTNVVIVAATLSTRHAQMYTCINLGF